MRLDKLVGDRFKERPTDCVLESHALMVRGGYMKQVANGIFSMYTPLRRITQKIEQIIREEMDAVDGQEVQFPVTLPASLWQESGRYDQIESELLRFQDRNKTPMVLGMTHEEACLHLVREYGQTYAKYPFMVYQIQTKFRDEARARGGLIRVREFTMKDGYSFHTSQEDLEQYYALCHKAYERIYARVGIPDVISVASDSGMMGGDISHEFMFLTPIGEDLLVVCPQCHYRANMEAAENIVKPNPDSYSPSLTKVSTPNQKTIEEVSTFLNTTQAKACKAVVYQRKADNGYVIVFMRGDLELQETKLAKYLACEIYPATITEESGLCAGYLGPIGLGENITVCFDTSLKGENNLICGANEDDYHYTGLDIARDIGDVEYADFAKVVEGGICPACKQENAVQLARGVEVGNIFQLGTKYTKSMNMQYTDQNGQEQFPIMGCYGIGVGRLAASVCEASHDDYGPIWPISIAPWQVHICALRSDDPEVAAIAPNLYQDLQKAGVEVIYDDRPVRPGFMFSDADLLGVPIRVVVSPKNCKEGVVEVVTRDKTLAEKVPTSSVLQYVQNLVGEKLAALRG